MPSTSGSAGEVRVKLALDVGDLRTQLTNAENSLSRRKGIPLKVSLSQETVKTTINNATQPFRQGAGLNQVTIPVRVTKGSVKDAVNEAIEGLKTNPVVIQIVAKVTGVEDPGGTNTPIDTRTPRRAKRTAMGSTVVAPRPFSAPISRFSSGGHLKPRLPVGARVIGQQHDDDEVVQPRIVHPRTGRYVPVVGPRSIARTEGRFTKGDRTVKLRATSAGTLRSLEPEVIYDSTVSHKPYDPAVTPPGLLPATQRGNVPSGAIRYPPLRVTPVVGPSGRARHQPEGLKPPRGGRDPRHGYIGHGLINPPGQQFSSRYNRLMAAAPASGARVRPQESRFGPHSPVSAFIGGGRPEYDLIQTSVGEFPMETGRIHMPGMGLVHPQGLPVPGPDPRPQFSPRDQRSRVHYDPKGGPEMFDEHPVTGVRFSVGRRGRWQRRQPPIIQRRAMRAARAAEDENRGAAVRGAGRYATYATGPEATPEREAWLRHRNQQNLEDYERERERLRLSLDRRRKHDPTQMRVRAVMAQYQSWQDWRESQALASQRISIVPDPRNATGYAVLPMGPDEENRPATPWAAITSVMPGMGHFLKATSDWYSDPSPRKAAKAMELSRTLTASFMERLQKEIRGGRTPLATDAQRAMNARNREGLSQGYMALRKMGLLSREGDIAPEAKEWLTQMGIRTHDLKPARSSRLRRRRRTRSWKTDVLRAYVSDERGNPLEDEFGEPMLRIPEADDIMTTAMATAVREEISTSEAQRQYVEMDLRKTRHEAEMVRQWREGGRYPVRKEYFDKQGNHRVKMDWKRDKGGPNERGRWTLSDPRFTERWKTDPTRLYYAEQMRELDKVRNRVLPAGERLKSRRRAMGGPLTRRLQGAAIQKAYDEGRYEEGQALQRELEGNLGGWGADDGRRLPSGNFSEMSAWRRRGLVSEEEWAIFQRRRQARKIVEKPWLNDPDMKRGVFAMGGPIRRANMGMAQLAPGWAGGTLPELAQHPDAVLVGEHGPEVFLPATAGTVYPNHYNGGYIPQFHGGGNLPAPHVEPHPPNKWWDNRARRGNTQGAWRSVTTGRLSSGDYYPGTTPVPPQPLAAPLGGSAMNVPPGQGRGRSARALSAQGWFYDLGSQQWISPQQIQQQFNNAGIPNLGPIPPIQGAAPAQAQAAAPVAAGGQPPGQPPQPPVGGGGGGAGGAGGAGGGPPAAGPRPPRQPRLPAANPLQRTRGFLAAQASIGDIFQQLAEVRQEGSNALQLSPVRALSVSVGQIFQEAFGGRRGIRTREAAARGAAGDAERLARRLQAQQETFSTSIQQIRSLREEARVQRSLGQDTTETMARIGLARERARGARAGAMALQGPVEEATIRAQILERGESRTVRSRPPADEARVRAIAQQMRDRGEGTGGILTTKNLLQAQGIGLAGIVVGTKLFTAGIQAVDAAMGLANQALEPLVDELMGFRGTASRVVDELSKGILGGTGGAAEVASVQARIGLSTGTPESERRARLLAGAQGFEQIQAALRAEGNLGTRSRTQGVFQGFNNGPLAGIPILGEAFGWIGQTQSISQRLEGPGRRIRNSTQRFLEDRSPEEFAMLQRAGLAGLSTGGARQFIGTPTYAQLAQALPQNQTGLTAEFIAQLMGVSADNRDINAQISTGSSQEQVRQINEVSALWDEINDNLSKVDSNLGQFNVTLNEGSKISKQTAQEFREQGMTLLADMVEEFGIEFTDANGQFVDRIVDAMDAAAQGATFQDPARLLTAMTPQLTAQIRQIYRQAEFQRETVIPGQLSRQLIETPQPTSGRVGLIPSGMGNFTGLGMLEEAASTVEGLREDLAAMALTDEQLTERLGVPQQAIDDVRALGTEIRRLSEIDSDLQLGQEQAQYNEQLRISQRSIGDLVGLVGRQTASYSRLVSVQDSGARVFGQQVIAATEYGRLQRAQIADSRQLSQIQLARSQRELNLALALARLRSPGETAAERAVRRREAEAQAREQQRELNINRRSTRRGFRIEDIGFQRQLGDALRAQGLSESERTISLRVRGSQAVQQALKDIQQQKLAFLDLSITVGTQLEEAAMETQAAIEAASGQFLDSFSTEVKRTLRIITRNAITSYGTAMEELAQTRTGTRADPRYADLGLIDTGGGSDRVRNSSAREARGRRGATVNININASVRDDRDVDSLVRKVIREIHQQAELVA